MAFLLYPAVTRPSVPAKYRAKEMNLNGEFAYDGEKG